MPKRIATSVDGTEIRGFDEGAGPPVVVLHPGMDDGTSWDRVSTRLAPHFRVVRVHRRTYRPDLRVDPRNSLKREVEDVVSVVRSLGGRAVLVGHSSGAVVALEAMAASPSSFAGAVLYEPPAPVEGLPLGGEALRRAESAADRGRTARSIAIFFREVVGYPAPSAWLFGAVVAAVPGLRPRARRQLVDCEAIDLAGVRVDRYSEIGVPILFLLGRRSPSHLRRRSEALRDALPGAHIVELPGQGHLANRLRPGWVAEAIARFHEALGEPRRNRASES
ncbi:alpha/beta fold hydrolase [Nocardiopsis alba]|uniref:alpha/beta fold hydrolase n=1 Tax=Nocardiopsis alba TaxID=53437 RepID=UPI00126983C6